jgi:REP element-mobilizing transposase RayT
MCDNEDPPNTDLKSFKTFYRNRSLRLPGFDYGSNHVYFITVGAYERRAAFADSNYAQAAATSLLDCLVRSGFACYAYCVMPDHVHLLVAPVHDGTSLPLFIGAFKSLSTRAYWDQGGGGRLWQSHYHDHVVRRIGVRATSVARLGRSCCRPGR